jgi:hypothetical protein
MALFPTKEEAPLWNYYLSLLILAILVITFVLSIVDVAKFTVERFGGAGHAQRFGVEGFGGAGHAGRFTEEPFIYKYQGSKNPLVRFTEEPFIYKYQGRKNPLVR